MEKYGVENRKKLLEDELSGIRSRRKALIKTGSAMPQVDADREAVLQEQLKRMDSEVHKG